MNKSPKLFTAWKLLSTTQRTLMMRLKHLTLAVVMTVGIVAASPSVMASDYIHDFNWSKIECFRIPMIVDRLNSLADYLFQKAEEARAEGNEGLASAYEDAGIEATIEAAEGAAAYSSGDCVQ